MKTIISVLFFIIVFQCNISAQLPPDMGIISGLPENEFNRFAVKYSPIDGFSFEKSFYMWPPYSVEGCCLLKSEDNNFLSLIEIVYAFYKFYWAIDKEKRMMLYIDRIRDHLIDIAGTYEESRRDIFTLSDLEKYVDFYPKEIALKKFNADIAITYTLPVKDVNDNFYVKQLEKEYTHCDVLMIQKNDKGPIFIYCFYTDKGYANRKKYYNKLEKAIGFNK